MTIFCRAIAITLLAVTTSMAQAPDSKAQARNALNSGVAAFMASRPREAVDLFNSALQLDPDLKVAELYLAAAYASLVPPVGAISSESQEFLKKSTELYERIIQREPSNVEALTGLGSLHSRSNDFRKAREVYLRITKLATQDPTPFYAVASTDWILVRTRTTPASEKGGLIVEGLTNVDIALALNPQHIDAMTYKNLLLREQAEIASDPEARENLMRQANEWFAKALKATQEQGQRPSRAGVAGGVAGSVIGTLPSPPPPPLSPAIRIGSAVAQANLVSSVPPKPPKYPLADVQGPVVLQATIDKQGTVSDLRVIRGHPLVQEAAIEAVKQWRYKPILLNGQPTEVVTEIMVNFTRQ